MVVIGLTIFIISRCAVGSVEKQAVIARKAEEQAALQDYYQTFGVRPANMAELELLEAQRRRAENDSRSAEQERTRKERAQQKFEEDFRRSSDAVSRDLAQAAELSRRRAEQERELQFQEEQLKLEANLATSDADRLRLELKAKQIRERRKAL